MPIKGDDITDLLGMIVRGLWYVKHKECMAQEMSFEVRRIYPWYVHEVVEDFQRVEGSGPYAIGDGRVSMGWYLRDRTEPRTSMWLLVFYERIWVQVIAQYVEEEAIHIAPLLKEEDIQ